MTRAWGRFGLLVCLALVSLSCATSSGVIVNPSAPRAVYHSAYLVVHGDRSSDVDTELQKELLRHGFEVSVGPDGNAPAGADLVVKYVDDWKWDVTMYLKSFDLMLFDAKSKVLLASGTWKNSPLHGYYGVDKVVGQVVSETLGKLGV